MTVGAALSVGCKHGGLSCSSIPGVVAVFVFCIVAERVADVMAGVLMCGLKWTMRRS